MSEQAALMASGGVGGLGGGGSRTEQEHNTLLELMRWQQQAMQHRQQPLHHGGGVPMVNHAGVPVAPGGSQWVLSAGEECARVAPAPATFQLAQLPAGLGYDVAPMVHPGKSRELCPTASVHRVCTASPVASRLQSNPRYRCACAQDTQSSQGVE